MEEQLQQALELLRKCYSYFLDNGLLEDFNDYAGIPQEETPAEVKQSEEVY